MLQLNLAVKLQKDTGINKCLRKILNTEFLFSTLDLLIIPQAFQMNSKSLLLLLKQQILNSKVSKSCFLFC